MTEEDRDAADPWLTLAEIAEELRVNPATVRQWVSKGQLKASRAGVRKWIVRRSDLDRMLAETNSSADDVLERVQRGEPPQLTSSPPRRPPSPPPSDEGRGSEQPAPGTKQANAARLVQYAADRFDRALHASAYAPPSPGYIDRMRAIADACEHIAATVLHASQTAGMLWRGRATVGPGSLPYELRRDGNRPWREGLWDQFDAAVDTLSIAMTGHEMTAVAEGFRDVAETLSTVADELERDDSWQAGSRAG